MREKKALMLIRADANPQIGMGHIMRCLSVADAAKTQGHDVIFILSNDIVEDLVRQHKYETIILHSDYTRMEDEHWPQINADLIIVDSYYVTSSYLDNLRQKTNCLVYIDDLNAFPYPVDVVVNYNAFGSSMDYQTKYINADIKPIFVLGPTYAPLRMMFRKIEKKKQRKTVENVLISTGGSDLEHIALRFIQAELKNRKYHILIGNMNPDKKKIEELSKEIDNIILHENVTDMKALISDMDIAVSAAGSTLYEICACGVPLITYALADNQIPGAEAFEKLGLAINLGDVRNMVDPSDIILTAIEELADDYRRRNNMGLQMQGTIDGLGADRMVTKLIQIWSQQKRV